MAAGQRGAEGLASTAIGLVPLLIGTTSVFGELQDALDRIWRAPARDRSGGLSGAGACSLAVVRHDPGNRLAAHGVAGLRRDVSALGRLWSGAFGEWALLVQLFNLVVGFVITTGVFAMIYKIMPRVSVKRRDVWLGAIVTSLLVTGGRHLIGLYIGRSNLASGFGAAGSLIVVIVWVCHTAQIFLLGAGFTWIYGRTFGSMRDLQPERAAKTGAPVPGFATDQAGPPQPPRVAR